MKQLIICNIIFLLKKNFQIIIKIKRKEEIKVKHIRHKTKACTIIIDIIMIYEM